MAAAPRGPRRRAPRRSRRPGGNSRRGRASVLRAFAGAAGGAVLLQAALVAGAALRTAFLTPCSVGFGLPFVPAGRPPLGARRRRAGGARGARRPRARRPLVGAGRRRADRVPLGDAPRGLAGPGVVSPRSLPGHLARTDLRRGPGAGPSSGPLPPRHPRRGPPPCSAPPGPWRPGAAPLPPDPWVGSRWPRSRSSPSRRCGSRAPGPAISPRAPGWTGSWAAGSPGPAAISTSPGRSPAPTPSASSATARPTSPRWPPRWGSPPPPLVKVWVHRSPEEKRRLVGAGRTEFTKPWLAELQVLDAPGRTAGPPPRDCPRRRRGRCGRAARRAGAIRGARGRRAGRGAGGGARGAARGVDRPRVGPRHEGPRAPSTRGAPRRAGRVLLGPGGPRLRGLGELPRLPARAARPGAGAARLRRCAVRAGLRSAHRGARALLARLPRRAFRSSRAGRRRRGPVPAGRAARTALRAGDRRARGARPGRRGAGDWEAAAALWRRAAGLSGDPSDLRGLGDALRGTDPTAADAAYAEALAAIGKGSPSLRSALLESRGDLAWRSGDGPGAVARYREALALHPDRPRERLLTAKIAASTRPELAAAAPWFLGTGNADEAMRALADSGDPLGAYLAGRGAVARGDLACRHPAPRARARRAAPLPRLPRRGALRARRGALPPGGSGGSPRGLGRAGADHRSGGRSGAGPARGAALRRVNRQVPPRSRSMAALGFFTPFLRSHQATLAPPAASTPR